MTIDRAIIDQSTAGPEVQDMELLKRYFVDLSDGSQSMYDYQGFYSPDLRGAVERAEWVAIDLEYSRHPGEWDGWTVALRDVSGAKLFSRTVRSDPEDVGARHLSPA
jgi:hypothetical protein